MSHDKIQQILETAISLGTHANQSPEWYALRNQPGVISGSEIGTILGLSPWTSAITLWAEKTGTSWSEAKKLGLTDGSAKSNLALLDKLKKGTVSKSSIADMKNPPKREKEETIPTLSVKGTTVTKSNASPSTSSSTSETTPKPTKDQMSGSGLGASERMEGMYKKGGSVKKKMKLKKK